jgi:hypothetical protein
MSRLVSDEPPCRLLSLPLNIENLNYSVKLSRLMEYFLLMSNKCDSHVGELLSSESCDLKVQLIEKLHFNSMKRTTIPSVDSPVEQCLIRIL